MSKAKVSPHEQKAKIMEQLKELEAKLVDFDNQRAMKVGQLAKRYQLIDLSDTILEKEFKAIKDKYAVELAGQQNNLDESKKNS